MRDRQWQVLMAISGAIEKNLYYLSLSSCVHPYITSGSSQPAEPKILFSNTNMQ